MKENEKRNYKLVLDECKKRQLILITLDLAIMLFSFITSYAIITNTKVVDSSLIIPIVIYMAINITSLYFFKCYTSLWRYAGIDEIFSIFIATIVSSVVAKITMNSLDVNFTTLFFFINCVSIILFISASRIIYRVARRFNVANIANIKSEEKNNILIVGAGNAGSMVIKEIQSNPELGKKVVAVIDDDRSKIGRRMHGVPIVGGIDKLKKAVEKYEVDEIIFSIAHLDHSRKSELINICKSTKCKLKTIPGIYEIIDGKVDIKKIRDVDIEDLLGREPIKTNLREISGYIENKVVLVTGGGGSIGSELCRQISTFKPKQLVIVDIYENNAYEIQQELIRKYGHNLNLKVIIASIRDEKRMDDIFKQYRPQVVFHAAAHKHVPLMEFSPGEAIKNNVFGTYKIAKLAEKYEANRFVLISTDKAVNPTNIMGATKRCAEMIIQLMNASSKTEFVAVRFGNVLGSNGSVIPLFKKQIAEGGPVTVTHPDIIRYFMTIPEAVQLVVQAGSMAKGGEIFVLDMGDPVKITELAENLIRLSGFEPDVDIDIEFTGLRPGEKLYEELLMDEEGLTETSHNKIFIGKPIDIDVKVIEDNLRILRNVVEKEDTVLIRNIMKMIVSTYKPEGETENEEVAITM